MKLVNRTLSSQVREILLKMINELDFMSKLPSEQNLATQLGVSRNTVHQALKELENQGLVIFRHGVGTFVTRYSGNGNIRYNIASLDSTSKIIAEHGYAHGTKNVHCDIRIAPTEIAEKLGSNSQLEVLYIERIRTADETPIVFVEDYIPYTDGMLEEFAKRKDTSLFEFINNYTPISFANTSIHAVLSNERQMKKLSLTEPKALLHLQQIHYSAKGIPVFYSDSYFITEKLEFNLIRRCIE